ncbi:MAG TPA: alpha/beta-type small acid-soluble spore protein [Anaerovoracaceae bacterium]|nr:alpha/beta-type small acid-soluble spore protein [Anaerovoracaceae bacterium]
MNKHSDSETNSKLNKLKTEFANETGIDISQYNNLNKASLTSRQNGYVGGYLGGTMTKRLVEIAEKQLMIDEDKK